MDSCELDKLSLDLKGFNLSWVNFNMDSCELDKLSLDLKGFNLSWVSRKAVEMRHVGCSKSAMVVRRTVIVIYTIEIRRRTGQIEEISRMLWAQYASTAEKALARPDSKMWK
ncbi:hypothetical protein QE152_g19083 [Popillia japonica]|uniref:Uncharacterized protein n=1 Tax=Popillia japonica TaxID=7064 RepID=A0AAW1L3D3_POPJA